MLDSMIIFPELKFQNIIIIISSICKPSIKAEKITSMIMLTNNMIIDKKYDLKNEALGLILTGESHEQDSKYGSNKLHKFWDLLLLGPSTNPS